MQVKFRVANGRAIICRSWKLREKWKDSAFKIDIWGRSTVLWWRNSKILRLLQCNGLTSVILYESMVNCPCPAWASPVPRARDVHHHSEQLLYCKWGSESIHWTNICWEARFVLDTKAITDMTSERNVVRGDWLSREMRNDLRCWMGQKTIGTPGRVCSCQTGCLVCGTGSGGSAVTSLKTFRISKWRKMSIKPDMGSFSVFPRSELLFCVCS